MINPGLLPDEEGYVPESQREGYPVSLSKWEARTLQNALIRHVDYPELEPELQALYDKLERVA